MQVVNVTAESRENTGKKANKVLRKEGRIPAVLYGKDGTKNLSVTQNGVKHLIYTPEFKIANLDLAGDSVSCFIKDVQFHPVNDSIVHIDFLQLIDDQKVKVNIPVRTKGESEAVKAGGKLVATMRKVTIHALPKDLVDEIFVDISELELGASVRVRDIEKPDNIEILTGEANPVYRVEIPRALKSMTAEEEAAAEAEAAAAPAEGDAAPAAEAPAE